MRGHWAFRRSEEIVADLPDHQLFVIRQPGNMMQQIANVDSPRVRRELGEILVERVVEVKFALFGKNHDCHGRELFGHGREFELRIERDGAVRLEVRKAEGCLPRDPAFADEDRNHAGCVSFAVWRDESFQTRVDRLRLGG